MENKDLEYWKNDNYRFNTKISPEDGTFFIKMKGDYLRKNDVIYFPSTQTARVKKVYPFNWWRRLLFRLGFKIKSANIELINKDELQ